MSDSDGGPLKTTGSGIPVDPVYSGWSAEGGTEPELGAPGSYPFTRGVHPTMYRGRLWTMRQYAGFGTAEDTNRRYQYLLRQGTTGLSVAFDLPTQMGFDSNHPMASGEVGRVGVAIDSLDDLDVLFRDIPLGDVSTSMTINSTAAILLAFYVALADERGVPREKIRGTVQNDVLKEYIARGTYIYPVEPSLRLVSDIMAFCGREIPSWNTISISGYHIREAGATAPQELAFTFANGLEYVDRALEAGLELDSFGPRLSFFFAAHNDVLEEVAKFRAARRLWAKLMKERYGASDSACRLRFHTQTGGSTLTAQQPHNNVVRVTLQALSAVLGGTQSLHTNSFDEALALPSEDSARLALRTQQILAHESGVTNTVDPLAGSYYVESLTDTVQDQATDYLAQIDEMGGAAKAVEFMKEEIHQAAYQYQLQIEAGERTVVGVNAYQEEGAPPTMEQPDYLALERDQKARLEAVRSARDSEAHGAALSRIRDAARSGENILPAMIEAAKSRSTLGEISDVLRDEWGTYDQG
jgi:methylmalonyl-CoA mutase N-terminal domain/subunit